jgi:hypothetical protein
MVELFDAIGLGQWFRYVTGSLEVLGAVLLLIPRLSGLGALLLVGTMLGAVATHLFVVGGSALGTTILLIVTGVIAWERRKRTMNLLAEIRSRLFSCSLARRRSPHRPSRRRRPPARLPPPPSARRLLVSEKWYEPLERIGSSWRNGRRRASIAAA